MRENNQNIENMIKDSLMELEVTPPADLKDSIDSQINFQKDRIINLRLILDVILVALFISSSLISSYAPKFINSINNVKSTYTHAIKETKLNERNSNYLSDSSNVGLDLENSSLMSATTLQKNQDLKIQKTKEYSKLTVGNKDGLTLVEGRIEMKNRSHNSRMFDKSKEILVGVNEKDPSEELYLNKFQGAKKSDSKPNEELPVNNFEVDLPLKQLTSIKGHYDLRSMVNRDTFNRHSSFMIGLGVTYSRQPLLDNTRKLEGDAFGEFGSVSANYFCLGIEGIYALNSNWLLRTGIEYGSLRGNYYGQLIELDSNIVTNQELVMDTNNQVVDTIYSMDYEYKTSQTESRYSYIINEFSIPLSVGYAHQFKRAPFGFQVNLGTSIKFGSSKYFNSNNQLDNPIKNKFGFDIWTKPELFYNKKDFQYILGVDVNWRVKSLLNFQHVERQSLLYGVHLGVRYKF